MAEKIKQALLVHSATSALTPEQLVIENNWLRTELYQARQQIANDLQTFERLRQQSQLDFLTQTPTRLLLSDRASQAFRQATRQHTEVLVVFIDIDRFKQINDHFGHSTGDQVLVQLAARLQQCLRITDTVCRYGGDEFVLLLPLTCEPRDVQQLVNKLLHCATQPMTISQQVIVPQISLGVAIYPLHGQTLASLIEKADQAMYAAKADGGRHFRISAMNGKTTG
ncbi:MAG: diguanylate cyclase domain-containing protein [Chromatiaceae bacterium]|jgi:diguanylate cyclase (GGDEF)-like protein